MAGSITSSAVEAPPLPGMRAPVERFTACLSASGGSIASVTYSFQTSFSAAPCVTGGLATGDFDGDVWVSSNSSTDLTVKAATQDRANASFTTKPTLSVFE